MPDQSPQVTQKFAAETHLGSTVQRGDGRKKHVGTETYVNKTDGEEQRVNRGLSDPGEVFPEEVEKADRVERCSYDKLGESYSPGDLEVGEVLEVGSLGGEVLGRVVCHGPVMVVLVIVKLVLTNLLCEFENYYN